MNHAEIYRIALAAGFKLKAQPDGTMDLNPYVYRFAEALLEQGRQVALYHRERAEGFKAERDEAARKWEEEKAVGDSLEERYEIVCGHLERAMDQVARLGRVEEERDALAVENRQLKSRCAWLDGERDALIDQKNALAAHVEWLDGLRRNVIEAIRDDRFEDLDVSFYRDDMQPEKPATSLARRDAHPDDLAVERFATAMKAKMATARQKGRDGWDDPDRCSVEVLCDLLFEHLEKGNPGNYVDIANLAMMLHHRRAPAEFLVTELGHRDAEMLSDIAVRLEIEGSSMLISPSTEQQALGRKRKYAATVIANESMRRRRQAEEAPSCD